MNTDGIRATVIRCISVQYPKATSEFTFPAIGSPTLELLAEAIGKALDRTDVRDELLANKTVDGAVAALSR